MAAKNTLEILIRANDQASNAIAGLAKSVSGSMQSVGTSMMKTGAGMGLLVAPAVAGFADAVGAAGDFESQMNNIQSVLGATDEKMVQVAGNIRAFGIQSRAGTMGVAEAFEEIAGGVEDSTTHMAILDASIRTAEAGQADLLGTTSAMVSVMNSYALSADDAAMVSDVLTRTVGMGVGSMEQFAGAFPAVTGLAASLGVSFEDIGTAAAFMTTKGFTASQSTNQLKAMMVSMLNPNKKMKESLEDIGFTSGTAAIEQLGLVGAFQLLNSESPTFQSNMAGAVGSVEALNGVIGLTDESFNDFADTFSEGVEGPTDSARKIQLDTFSAQMDLLKSSAEGLKITIGLALIPILTKVVSTVTPIVQSFMWWIGANSKLVTAVASVAAGVGAFAAGITALGGALAFLPALLGLLVSPLALIAAGVGAFAYVLTTLDTDAFDNVVWSFKEFIATLGTFDPNVILRQFGLFLIDLAFIFTSGIRETKIGSIIWDDLSKELQILRTMLESGSARNIARAAGNFAVKLVTSVAKAFPNNWLSKIITGDLSDELEKLRTAFRKGRGIGEAFKELGKSILDIGGAAVGDALGKIFSAENLKTALGAIKNVGSFILGALAAGIGAIAGWAMDNIISPIADQFTVENAMIILANAIIIGSKIIGAIAEGLGSVATWVDDNILSKIGDQLTEENAQAALEGAQVVGGAILSALGTGLGSVASWINTNVIQAITTFLGNEDKVQAISSAAGELAGSIINGLASGIGSIAAWINTNVIQAIINSIKGGGGDDRGGGGVEASALEMGWKVLKGIAEAFLDMPAWVAENVIVPFVLGLTGTENLNELVTAAKEGGLSILEGFLNGIAGIGQALFDAIKAEIDAFDFSSLIPDIDLNPFNNDDNREPAGSGGGGRGFRALGGPVASNAPYIVGERGPELFVPQSSGRIVPNNQLGSSGAAGGASVMNMEGANIVLPGVTNARQFFDELEREARRRNRQFAPARGGA